MARYGPAAREGAFMTGSPIPGYWQNETSGVLRPAVEAYLFGHPMTLMQIAAMRAYLRQWIKAFGNGEGLPELRRQAETIRTRADIDQWLRLAVDEGIDPL
jgi:hypothetical protein